MALWSVKSAHGLAAFGLVLLFPGYFTYHYSVSQGLVAPVLGGLFGGGAALLAVPWVLVGPWIVRTRLMALPVPSLLVFGTMLYVLLWALVHYAVSLDAPYATAALGETARMLVIWLGMLFIGLFYSFDQRSGGRWFAVSAAVVGLAVAHAFVVQARFDALYLAFSGFGDEANWSSYQGAGRALLVTTVFIAAHLRSHTIRVVILVLGIPVLMSQGARAELVALAYLSGVLIALGLSARARVGGFAVGVVLIPLLGFLLRPHLDGLRVVELLHLDFSASWVARSELSAIAQDVIRRAPILGDYGYHLRELGSGGYSHNALSAWTNYGAVGFMLYAGLLLGFALAAIRRLDQGGRESPEWFAAFSLTLLALVLSLATPVSAPVPALAWGMTMNALSKERALGAAAGRGPAGDRSE